MYSIEQIHGSFSKMYTVLFYGEKIIHSERINYAKFDTIQLVFVAVVVAATAAAAAVCYLCYSLITIISICNFANVISLQERNSINFFSARQHFCCYWFFFMWIERKREKTCIEIKRAIASNEMNCDRITSVNIWRDLIDFTYKSESGGEVSQIAER